MRGQSWRPNYEVKVLGLPLPMVTGPYQGALKTYLLAPLVAALGTRPTVLRGFNAVLAFLFLCVLFWAFAPLLKPTPRAGVFLLPLMVPHFLWFVPTDYGPFLLGLSFSAFGLGALVRADAISSQRFLPLVGLAAGLSVGDKLTAMPAAGTLLALSLAVLLMKRQRPSRPGRTLLMTVLMFALPVLPFVAYFYLHGFAELEANTHIAVPQWLKGLTLSPASATVSCPPLKLEDRLKVIWSGFKLMGSGNFLPEALSGDRLEPAVPWGFWIFLAIAFFSLPLCWTVKKLGRAEAKNWLLLAASWPLLVLLFLLTPGLDRPWHFFPLLPFSVAACVAGLWATKQLLLFCACSRAARWVMGAALLIAALSLAQRGVQLGYWLSQREGANLTSPAIEVVAGRLVEVQPRRLLCINYSVCNPLYVLGEGRFEILDLTWWTNPPEDWLSWVLQQPGTWVVVREAVPRPATPQSQLEFLNGQNQRLLPRLLALCGLSELPPPIAVDAHGTRFYLWQCGNFEAVSPGG